MTPQLVAAQCDVEQAREDQACDADTCEHRVCRKRDENECDNSANSSPFNQIATCRMRYSARAAGKLFDIFTEGQRTQLEPLDHR